MPALVVVEGENQGRLIDLAKRAVSIGRDPGNDLVVSDPAVSRRHAVVEWTSGVCVVRDLGSDNGTFVNDIPVGRAVLLDQDEIRIGPARLLFVQNIEDVEKIQGPAGAPVLEPTEPSEDFFIDRPTETAPVQVAPAADELRRAYDHLKTIYVLLRPEGRPQEAGEQIQQALALARQAIEADRLTLVERDPASDGGYKARWMVTAPGVSSRNRIAISQTVFSYVEAERKAFFCSNPQADERVDASASLRQSGIRSVLCVPIVEQGEMVGFLYADNFVSREPFDKEDLDFLTAVAGVVGERLKTLTSGPVLVSAGAGGVSIEVGRHVFVTQNARMKEILGVVEKVARTETTFLITGESGTGKELIARMAHQASRRASGPFVCVNCAALPDTLLESELFGHVKGAFTGAVANRAGKFEAARGGTVFLDEIGDISPAAQAKILRVLQEKEIERIGDNRPIAVDVRIIAATNKDLAEEIRAGRFREDLFYRLNVITIELPPLRERLDDIPALVDYFIRTFRREIPSPVKRLSPDALEAFKRYPWPGNVRELRNVIERAVVLGSKEEIGIDDLPAELRGEAPTAAGQKVPLAEAADGQALRSLAECEREHILRVLNYTGWNKKRSAEILGISRSALYEKIATYSLEAP